MKNDKALVVLSGGQDSTTCLYIAKKLYSEVHAISFNYGQRNFIELAAAEFISKTADVKSYEVINIKDILVSSSPLISNNSLETYQNYEEMDKIIGARQELTFVPMRNAFFLTIAANRAEVLDIKNIFSGLRQFHNENYDDCRQIFVDNAEQYINTALGHDHRGTEAIKLHNPLMDVSKAESVNIAHDLPGCWEALAYSHTGYDGVFPPTDMNRANVLRAQGFEEARYPDPLVVRAWYLNLMTLPDTHNYDLLRQEEGKIPNFEYAIKLSKIKS
jgi:7-cyano-7-deazaguanine synthase